MAKAPTHDWLEGYQKWSTEISYCHLDVLQEVIFMPQLWLFFEDWGKLFFPTVMYNTSSQQISLKAEGYDSEPWKFSSSLQLSKMFFYGRNVLKELLKGMRSLYPNRTTKQIHGCCIYIFYDTENTHRYTYIYILIDIHIY